MACVGGAPGRCAERCGGDRLCPLVLSLVLYIAIRHATDGARSANLDALGCLPGRTCRVVGAQSFDLVEFHRRQIRCDGARRVAGDVLASRFRCATAFGVVLAIFRIVSLSSMVAALTAIALICGLEQPLPYRLLVIAGSIYVIVRHRANIQRLLAGTEPRLGKVA